MNSDYYATVQYNVQPKKCYSVRSELQNYSYTIDLKIPHNYNDKVILEMLNDVVEISNYKIIHSPKVVYKISLEEKNSESALEKLLNNFPKTLR